MTDNISLLLNEARLESNDLRSHNFHLLTQVIKIINPSTNDDNDNNNNNNNNNELYQNILKQVEYLHIEYSSKQKYYNDKITNLNNLVIENDENAINLKNTFKGFRRKICKNINKKSSNSTKIETKWILQKEEEEEEIEGEIEQQRLKNIHFNINIKKLIQKIKEKDKLSDGLHLIDFEQLKIENQTLNEKIEERNDELYKLKKKITNTVQILTHIKEKLQFINKINQKLIEKQTFLDNVVNDKRDKLNELKKKRDLLRTKNVKIKQKQGFIGNDILVVDLLKTRRNLKSNQDKLNQYKVQYQQLLANKLNENLAQTF